MAPRRRVKFDPSVALGDLIRRMEEVTGFKAAPAPIPAPAVTVTALAIEAVPAPAFVATSNQIADRLGIPHFRLLEKVRKLLAGNADGVWASNCAETSYLDIDSRTRPAFELTRHGAWLLASSYRGPVAAALRDEFAADETVSLAPVIDKTDSYYRQGLADGYAAGLREGRAAGFSDGANSVKAEMAAYVERLAAAPVEAV